MGDIYVKENTLFGIIDIPVIISESGIKDVVYNDFHIGENANIIIVAGCGIHNIKHKTSEHDGIHRFYLGKNSKVRYVEKHYGEGSGNKVFNPITEAIALVVGGLIIFWIENLHAKRNYAPRVQSMDDMTIKDAFLVGCMQCIAMIPGTSRSGATIIGGLVLGLSRKAATEFSFFLAIPTIFGATVYSLAKIFLRVSNEHSFVWTTDMTAGFAVGFIVSFISALIVVKWLLRYVSSNDFKSFGWYRIIFGVIIIGTHYSGLVQW